MKNFDEIINNGVIRWSERENDSLKPTGHVSDNENGVFKVGNLMVMVTVERDKDEIVEYVSISKKGLKKPGILEIGKVIQLFWHDHEIDNVCRLGIKSDIIHLRRRREFDVNNYAEVQYASESASYS